MPSMRGGDAAFCQITLTSCFIDHARCVSVGMFTCQVAGEVRQLKAELKKKRYLLQMDELKCRKRVLRRMGYATAADVIELKGRVACEISR